MGKFTPGPWNVSRDGTSVYYVNPAIEAGDESIEDPRHDSTVAFCGGFGDLYSETGESLGFASGIPEEEQEANARLIAAAPVMYEALRLCAALLPSLQAPWGETGMWEQAQRDTLRAIALAEGG